MDSDIILRRAERVGNCAEYVRALMCGECGKITRMRSSWCKDRLCPMCAERQSRAVAAQAMQVVPHLHGTPLLVTLTVRNVPGHQLDAMLDQMLLAWRKMRDQRKVRRGLLGWARNLEITYNRARNDYHPHIHAIIYTADQSMAKASYWGNLWREVMQLDYDPIIDVRPIKDGAGAVAEISKYVTKVNKILDLPDGIVDEVVQTLATALHKRRLRAYGGEWARVRRAIGAVDEDKLTDEQIDGLSDEAEGIECCGHEMVEVIMRWTGDDYDVTRADDGSPMVVPEPEAVPWPD